MISFSLRGPDRRTGKLIAYHGASESSIPVTGNPWVMKTAASKGFVTVRYDGLTLRWKAPAKLNLFLRIVGRRPDGYHLIDSLMVPINLFDIMDITFAPGPTKGVEVATVGLAEVSAADNLASRAAKLFLEKTGISGRVVIDLQKRIPPGTGLGGGSSDAAAVLRALNQLSGAAVNTVTLAHWARTLGTDVPFFVHGCPARVRGVGEIIEPVEDAPRMVLVVACKEPGLATADVYREYDRTLTNTGRAPIKENLAGPSAPLREFLVNDLEPAASRIRPGIALVKQKLLDLGALAAVMTGSGSAVFGVWEEVGDATRAVATLLAEGIWGQFVEILDRT